MRLLHRALALIAVAGLGHAVSSCGRTELNRGPVSSGGTTAGNASVPPGGAGGTTLLPEPLPCAALDARSSATRCWERSGYTWNGSSCEEVVCSCAGTDCARLFATVEECDTAYAACYAEVGIDRSC